MTLNIIIISYLDPSIKKKKNNEVPEFYYILLLRERKTIFNLLYVY